MADQVIRFCAGFVPALFSAFPALLSTQDLMTTQLITPALKYARSLHSREACRSCLQHVEWFVRLSLERLQLTATLLFIASGLLAQAIILFVDGNVMPGISYLSYFIIPTMFCFYYVWLRREVFHWWDSPQYRFALVFAVGATSALTAVDPQAVSVLDILAGSAPYRDIMGVIIPNLYLRLLIVVVVAVYALARGWQILTNRRSLRNVLLDFLDESDKGFTTDDVMERLQKLKGREIWERREVNDQLQKLTYQELIVPEQVAGLESPRYRRL
jgi:hypothetical protein